MKPVKQIVIVHYSLPPTVGGVENMLRPLAEVFSKNNYIVTLLTGEGKVEGTNIKTSTIPDLNPNNPHIKTMQRILGLGSLPEAYEYKLLTFQKRIEMEIGDIETVIIHNILTMPFNLIATEAFWNYIEMNPQKRFFLWTHDLAWLMDDYKNYLYDRRPWSLMKTPPANVTYVAVSEYRKRQIADFLNIPRKKIIVVPNVLKYQDFLRFDENTNLVIRKLNIFAKHPVILLPSRILPRKNLERSIQIITILKKTFPNILGVITGIPEWEDGNLNPYSKALKTLIRENQMEENIVFLADTFDELNIPHEKNRNVVHDLYFVCHIVLFLSTDEGFGLPVLEAGAARTPIALTPLPVFREIADENAIYLPTDESVDYNATRLTKFFAENQSKSDFLFKKVFTHYNWDTLWEDYLKAIFEEDSPSDPSVY